MNIEVALRRTSKTRTATAGDQRKTDGEQREGQPQQDGVDDHQPEIVAPPHDAGDLAPPPRGREFGQCQRSENAEEDAEPDRRLLLY